MSDKKHLIIAALLTLQVDNDAHWTASGEPRLDVIRGAVNDNTLTRAQLEEAAPGFSRKTAEQWAATHAELQETASSASENPESGKGSDPVADGQGNATDELPDEQADSTGAGSSSEPTNDGPDEGEPAPAMTVGDEIRALTAELKERERILSQMRAELEERVRLVEDYTAQVDALRNHIESLRTPEQTNAECIAAYLQARTKAMESRAEQVRLLKEAGLDVATIKKSLALKLGSV